MKIPQPNHTTAAMIDAYHESKPDLPRPHLGGSMLGHHCERWLWLSFRWAVREPFPGRILRLFRRGQNEEATVVADLRAIGCEVVDQMADGSQWRVDFGKHVSGSIDGMITQGLPEAPKAKHLLEIKTHSKKSFDDLEKKAVKDSKPQHWAQMQVYMHGTGVDRALYAAVCKDDDRYYFERVHYDKDASEALIKRGHSVTMADRLPPPISTDPSWYQCKFCAAHDFCHGSKQTEQINCRTCAHYTAQPDSTSHCARWDAVIPVDAQRQGCESHVVHPDLIPHKMVDGDGINAVYDVDGRRVVNGEGGISSRELLGVSDA